MTWTTVVPAAITGAVGIAGIGGALLSARITSKSAAENLRTSIAAEDARANLAEKRRIYANCLGALTAFLTAEIRKQNAPCRQSDRANQAYTPALLATSSAVWEVILITSIEVANQTARVFDAVIHMDAAAPQIDDTLRVLAQAGEIGDAISTLSETMRRDLGEEALDVPDLTSR